MNGKVKGPQATVRYSCGHLVVMVVVPFLQPDDQVLAFVQRSSVSGNNVGGDFRVHKTRRSGPKSPAVSRQTVSFDCFFLSGLYLVMASPPRLSAYVP
jgi:hypothetical protein